MAWARVNSKKPFIHDYSYIIIITIILAPWSHVQAGHQGTPLRGRPAQVPACMPAPYYQSSWSAYLKPYLSLKLAWLIVLLIDRYPEIPFIEKQGSASVYRVARAFVPKHAARARE